MSDTSFGGGLDIGGASATAGPAGADVPPSGPASPGGFGSSLKGVFSDLTGPKTQAPKPGASNLDNAERTLQTSVDFYSNAAANPIWQFFDPEGVAKARNAAVQGTEKIQQIRQQKAQQTEIQMVARNYGIHNIPEGADRETSLNMMADELHGRYLNGDPTAATALQQLGRSDLVQAGAEQALSAAVANNQRYRDAFGRLSSAKTPGQFDAARAQLEQETKDGKHKPEELAGVPRTFEEFQKKKQLIGNSLAVQQLQIDSQRARMQQLGKDSVVPITKQTDKDGNAIGLHATTAGAYADNNGNAMRGVEPVTVGGIYNGNRLPVGSSKIGEAGEKWGLLPSPEVAEIQKRVEPHKAGLERAAGIDKLNDIASEKDFGTNAWLLGHGIDQFVEISRNGVGGKGSATPGTIQIMENLRGHLQTFGDKAQKEWRQLEDWVTEGKSGPAPYMSPETIKGLKDAITTLKSGSDREVAGNVGSTAEYVGRHGGKLSDMGLEPGVADTVKSFWKQGNDAFKQDLASRPSIVIGNQRVVFDPQGPRPDTAAAPGGFGNSADDTNHPDRNKALPSAGTPPSAVPTGGGPKPPGPAVSPAPGGGGPVQIAGASVTPPPIDGASPAFLAATQRIESGNEKTPWTAGNDRSSAKGAFQFINDTWATNKPPGAPDDPRKATPQQQTEAVANLANKNAASLKAAGLPANDTTLYMAHNVGAGGAAKLLHADPNADARTVIGEREARNNPLFFKGRPTVATVLQRYANEMEKGGVTGGNIADAARHSSGAAQQRAAFGRNPNGSPVAPPISGPNIDGQTGAGKFNTGRTDVNETDAIQKGVEAAPAIGGTAGAVLAGPAGGAAGGAGGQMLQNYMHGEKVFQPNVVGSAFFGAAGGVGGNTVKGTLARTTVAGTGGGVEGGLEEGTAGGVIRGAVKAGAGAAFGESVARTGAKVANVASAVLDKFGGFLGMGGHQTFSRLTPEAQKAYMESAKVVAEGKPEAPAAMPGGGKNEAATKAYEAKLADFEDAERHMKTVLPHVKPEEGAYAAQQVGNDKGEAVTGRPMAEERADVAKGLNEVRQEVAEAGKEKGITKVHARGALPDGPMANLRTEANPSGKIPNAPGVETALQNAEMLATAPAPGGIAQRWDNILKARSELLEQERTALGGASPDKTKAKALRAGADALLPEVQRVAEGLFGKEGAPQVMERMKTLWGRYQRVMSLSAGGDVAATIAKGGKEGRDAREAYKALASDDPTAQRIMNALVRLKKGVSWQEVGLMVPIIAGEIGAGGHGLVAGTAAVAKLSQLAHDWIVKRGAGQPVKMDQIIAKSKAPPIDSATAGRAGAAQGARAGEAAFQQ